MGYIYKIKNKIDNKTYIGQTTQDLESRWRNHRKNSSKCRYLNSAFKKYGVENFEFKLVCITFDNQLDDMEIKYIEQYKCLVPNGYNIRLGGNSGKHHEETKRKIAATLLKNRKIVQFDIQGNRLKSFATCREAAEYVGVSRGFISTCCLNTNQTGKGFYWKYESMNSSDINSEGQDDIYKQIASKKNRKVIQFDFQGNRLNSFDSCREAGASVGVSHDCISRCCNGIRQSSKGYIWKYESIL